MLVIGDSSSVVLINLNRCVTLNNISSIQCNTIKQDPLRNKAVSSDLQEERDKCNFDKAEMRESFYGSKEEVDKERVGLMTWTMTQC